jgi:nucleoside-diphosphate-sugar epimerase
VASRSDAGRVLVTGCSGFTGRHLAQRLTAAGYEVWDPEAGGRTFDLTRPDTLRPAIEAAGPDYVIHLAALSFVGHDDASGFYRVNTVGTTHLLEALLASGVRLRRVLVASSANVYGNSRDDPITELTRPAPVNHYAASKLAMEYMVATYADRLPLVVLRPFNYTGVGQSRQFLIPKLVEHFAQRRPVIELGNVDVVRDFSDVRGVVDAYVRLLEVAAPPAVVNLCSGVGRSIQQMLTDLTELSGHRVEVRINPEFVRASEVHRLVGSAERLRATLGELPFADFRETLRWMLAQRGDGEQPRS